MVPASLPNFGNILLEPLLEPARLESRLARVRLKEPGMLPPSLPESILELPGNSVQV